MIGIDMGVVNFATTSLGKHINPINSFKKYSRLLRVAQRRMARKVKYSSNWEKAKHRVQDIHGKIANVRRDFLHKTSTELSKKPRHNCNGRFESFQHEQICKRGY